MKTYVKFFVSVCVALFAFACATDPTEDLGAKVGTENQTTLTLSLEGTKTYLGDENNGTYPLYWSVGDQISVNGAVSADLKEGGMASASFTFNQTLNYPYSVLYPGNANNEVTFLANQEYTAGTFCAGSAPMYGYAENAEGAIELQHLAGALCFEVSGEDTLTSVVVESEYGNLAGTYIVDCTTGALTTVTGTTSKSVTLTFGEGLALGAEATPIYVAVPAGSYGKVSVTFHAASGTKMAVKFDTSSKAITAGRVRKFDPITYVGVPDNDFIIDSKEALIKFAAAPTKSARVTANIDMTGETWNSIEGFAHSFDGGNFEIKGLTAPLFGTTSALEIKNVKLTNVNIVETINPNIGALARKIESAEGVVTNCSASGSLVVNCTSAPTETIYTAGLIGTSTSTKTFSHLTNGINITINGDIYPSYYAIAGVVGTLGDGSLSNSTNLGIIRMNGSAGNTLYIAGVVISCKNMTECCNGKKDDTAEVKSGSLLFNNSKHGYSLCMGGLIDKHSGDVTNCYNYGDISVSGNAGAASYIAGIARYYKGNNEQKLSGCHNYGNITTKDFTTSFTYICGGIISIPIPNGSCIDCHNHGDITFTNSTIGNYTHIGGIFAHVSDNTGFTVSDCSNSGNFDINGTFATCSIGGLAGRFVKNTVASLAMTISGSFTNSGNITLGENFNATEAPTGGIFGAIKDATVTVSASESGTVKNTGVITFKGNIGTATNDSTKIGGIVGYIGSSGKLICNCPLENSGAITSDAANYIGYNYLGGIVGVVEDGTIQTEAMVTNSGSLSIHKGTATTNAAGGLLGIVIARNAHAYLYTYGGFNNSGSIYVNVNDVTCNCVQVGGYSGRFYTTNSKKAYCTINGSCTNSGAITVDGDEGTVVTTLHAAGIMANLDSSAWLNLNENCVITNTETGVITVQNVKATTVQLSGFVGDVRRDMHSDSTLKIVNKGNINLLSPASVRVVIGGIIGLTTKKFMSGTITIENSGNIKCSGTYDKSKVNSIAGLFGSLYNGTIALDIAEARCFCNIDAVGYDCVGMITGLAYNSGKHYVKNCHVGGSVRNVADDLGYAETTTLDRITYLDYLYAGGVSETEAIADKCGVLEKSITDTPIDINGNPIVTE